ncbi:hypothetical protein ACO0K0_03890 [Undibacterium sp. SXout11W]|uniref:hypothetical protein n=1 Tax=Undibacterium sp. SXout11W TaxID=3413050 RepID=UPI003BF375B8
MSNKKQNLNLKSVVKKIKGKETKQISVTIPIDLISKFDAQKKEMERHGYTLNISEICSEAIEISLAIADREMTEILRNQSIEKVENSHA